MLRHGLSIPDDQLDAFCHRHGVARLSLFGSALRDALRPDSDVDLLVSFLPGRTPGLFAFSRMEQELSEMFGRRVDLRTAEDLSPYFRGEVVAKAEALRVA